MKISRFSFILALSLGSLLSLAAVAEIAQAYKPALIRIQGQSAEGGGYLIDLQWGSSLESCSDATDAVADAVVNEFINKCAKADGYPLDADKTIANLRTRAKDASHVCMLVSHPGSSRDYCQCKSLVPIYAKCMVPVRPRPQVSAPASSARWQPAPAPIWQKNLAAEAKVKRLLCKISPDTCLAPAADPASHEVDVLPEAGGSAQPATAGEDPIVVQGE